MEDKELSDEELKEALENIKSDLQDRAASQRKKQIADRESEPGTTKFYAPGKISKSISDYQGF